MSNMIDILKKRRSIRLFSDKPVDAKQLEKLQQALLRAPTSRGKNPWQFIRVDDRNLLEKISMAKAHGSAFLAGAAVAYIICGDETVSDVWIEDCSIAAISLQYAAHDLGLGSCWAQIRLREHNDNQSAEEYLRTLLTIPEQMRILSIIGIGHPAEEKPGHLAEQLPKDRIHINSY